MFMDAAINGVKNEANVATNKAIIRLWFSFSDLQDFSVVTNNSPFNIFFFNVNNLIFYSSLDKCLVNSFKPFKRPFNEFSSIFLSAL